LIYQSAFSSFNDVMGKENRHTVGLRSNGRIGKLSFNTELIYQFGQLASSEISAFNFETDWQYQLSQRSWLPKLGLKLDFSSGDKQSGDGKIQTFNPLFVNPAIYSLAAVNTPANISSFHPNFSFSPIKKLRVYLDYAVFYRSQENDGLYAPPNFQTRKTNGIKEKHIGDVIGLELQYRFNRNIFFNLRSSYFIAGNFIKASGPAKNTFYIAPTLSLKF
jgi:hypothetical protein